MSIIAYASANADPVNNPLEDAEIDLATASTPASVSLYGDAVDTEDAGASFSFAWSLLDPTSGPVLSATDTQNITVSNISAWHNIRLHLVATNTATSETSETDVILAPSASFVEIRVLSENRGIQKVAKGSRSWHPALEDWADAIEASDALNDLSDITNATGAELEILRGGGLAESGGSALHTHAGAHIADATTTTSGVVQLEEASDATGTPRVITQERVILSASTSISVDSSGTRHDEIIVVSTPTLTIPHASFVVSRHDIKIHAFSFSLRDCGSTTNTFKVYIGHLTQAAALTRAAPTLIGGISRTPSAANSPIIATDTLTTPVTVSAGDVIVAVVEQGGSAGQGGQQLDVIIEATRSVT